MPRHGMAFSQEDRHLTYRESETLGRVGDPHWDGGAVAVDRGIAGAVDIEDGDDSGFEAVYVIGGHVDALFEDTESESLKRNFGDCSHVAMKAGVRIGTSCNKDQDGRRLREDEGTVLVVGVCAKPDVYFRGSMR